MKKYVSFYLKIKRKLIWKIIDTKLKIFNSKYNLEKVWVIFQDFFLVLIIDFIDKTNKKVEFKF